MSEEASQSGSLTVEKTMSASADEFHRSIAVLEPNLTAGLAHRLACGSGLVTISYEPLPGITLGTSLALPRARVRLVFDGATDANRAAFLRRFDFAFQRGGG